MELDTNNYYNDLANKQPKGSYAAANHNHNGVYQPAGSYAAASHSHTFASITSKPTTLAGYGITDLGIDYYTTSTPTNYVSFSGSIALESSNAFYLEVYKIGKLVHFVMQVKISNSNAGAWKVKINKYPIKNTCQIFSAFKGTGSYVPCYGDKDGYIINQAGTGKYQIIMGGVYITT